MTRRLLVDADALTRLLEAALARPNPAATAAASDLLWYGTTKPPDPWCSVDEAARLLGVSERTVRRAVQRGELPHRRVGRRLLIARRAVTGPERTRADTPQDTGPTARQGDHHHPEGQP